jgi:hypothetical protein
MMEHVRQPVHQATRPVGLRVLRAPLRATVAVVLGATVGSRQVGAQGASTITGGRLADWADAAVGSEEESYLRVLDVAGVVRAGPWTLRPVGPLQRARALGDSARPVPPHPWSARMPSLDADAPTASLRVLWPAAGLAFNSDVPWSLNDGVVWAGRGLTGVARGGVAARWRWVTLRLEPTAFWTANRPYPIAPNGRSGPERFADALEPNVIDNPQRFGDRALGRVTLGQSTLRVDASAVAIGISTANQWLGPAIADPLLLGTNAEGFAHVFVGTARPISVLQLFTLDVRAQAGRLTQSSFSTTAARDSTTRLATAISAVLRARAVPGLELGGARFFHGAWERDWDGIEPRLRALFQTFFVFGGDTKVSQNQISSLWLRWALPGAGTEVWGEFMRNDASANGRDLLVEADHNSGYTVGARRLRRRGSTIDAVRLEVLDTRITHLQRIRGQVRSYQHNQFRQGHTMRGQVLGSASAQGGSASTLGWDRYAPDGRWTVDVSRRAVQSTLDEGAPMDRLDVLHTLRAERLRFGRRGDLLVGSALLWQANRAFGRDVVSLRLDAGWRFGAFAGAGRR